MATLKAIQFAIVSKIMELPFPRCQLFLNYFLRPAVLITVQMRRRKDGDLLQILWRSRSK